MQIDPNESHGVQVNSSTSTSISISISTSTSTSMSISISAWITARLADYQPGSATDAQGAGQLSRE